MQSCGNISIADSCLADCLYMPCLYFSSPGCLSVEDSQGNELGKVSLHGRMNRSPAADFIFWALLEERQHLRL